PATPHRLAFFLLISCTVNKSTLRGIVSRSHPCRVILHPVTCGGECRQICEESPASSPLSPNFFFLCLCTQDREGGTLVPAMEEVLKCLAEVSIRQQQIAEHLAARVGLMEEEVTAIQLSAAQRVPLPDARAQATRLLPKMTADDDVEAFLQVFENTAHRELWPEEEWARALAPLLTGEAQRAYFSLPLAVAEEYYEVKREILARLGLSPICAAQQFHEWEFKPRVPARAQAAELNRIAQHWLLEGNPTAAQVAERVVVDRLLRALPRAHRQAVGMRNPTTTQELVEAIELADAVHHREPKDRVPPSGTRSKAPRDQSAGRWFPHREMRPCPVLNHCHLRVRGWQAASFISVRRDGGWKA
ncbi:hypothetical protein M9458_041677, partial [Cirrhinus mrigala]